MLVAVPAHLGYGALGGLVFAESAGVPLPGETALIAAGLLAGSAQLSLPAVVAVAAGAAVLGDNLGYWLGRRYGRNVLVRGPAWLWRHSTRAVDKSDAFFARHGGKAVFLGRWVSGVRVAAAVLAGASRMPWTRFLAFNALGAVAWSASIAVSVALLGPAAAAAISGTGLAIALLGGAFVGLRAWLSRRSPNALPQAV